MLRDDEDKPTLEMINKPFTLYRNSGKNEPSQEWSTDPSLYDIEGTGKKNKGGFFFLTDSIDLAYDLWWRDRKSGYFLTESRILSSINIIDFSTCRTIWEMLETLQDIGVNVFNDQIKVFDPIHEKAGINTLYDLTDSWNKSQNDSNYISLINKLYNNNLGRFGQNLTDDTNGPFFYHLIKQVTQGWDHPIDGYRFTESGDPRGYTYCFFKSEKLSPPEHKWIDLDTAWKLLS